MSSATPATPRACLFLAAVASCLLAPAARAQWSVDASVERFDWRERVSPIEVHEVGPRVALGAGFMPKTASGIVLAYRGSIYGGDVGYDGSLLFDRTKAASGTSIYWGTTQAAELRYRWPISIDVVAGLDLNLWRRRLSATQHEDYRVLSGRLGVDRPARSDPIVAGVGIRWLLATHEEATFTEAGVPYAVSLSPGLGRNLYLHVGCRVAPRLTAIVFWDGMRLGRSGDIAVIIGGRRTTVYQPATNLDLLGVRLTYAL